MVHNNKQYTNQTKSKQLQDRQETLEDRFELRYALGS